MRRLFLVFPVLIALLHHPVHAQPGAYDLLEDVRRAYQQLGSYHDRGTLERTERRAGREQTVRLGFETRAHGERVLWRLWAENDPTWERVLWRNDAEIFAWDRRLEQMRTLPSFAAELAHGFGEGGLETWVVPLLLAGNDAALADAEGAALDGPLPCGDFGGRSCWELTLSRMGGDLETLLQVDRESHLVLRVEVSFYSLGSAEAHLTLVAEHRLQDAPLDDATLVFEPPTTARRVDDWDHGAVAAEDGEGGANIPGLGFVDEITVELATINLRVVAKNGEPLADLDPDDLRVRIGRQETPITALDWVAPAPSRRSSGSSFSHRRTPSANRLAGESTPHTSGLKVLFVQADFEPTRMRGQMKLLPLVEELLDGLPPEDQVAVVTFDSHLRLWRDFTRDRELLKRTLFDAIRPGGHPVIRTSERGHPSLYEHLNHRAAKDAAETETALLVVAEALEKIPGEKDMIFLGWGLGILRSGTVHMTADYRLAVPALERADVTVNVLDVTEADWHSLEVGLKNVAEHTGGTYQRTFHFASQATRRLAHMFTGHYVLTFDRSAVPRARGKLKIDLVAREGEVLFRPTSY